MRPSLLARFGRATAESGIVLTTPTDLKSAVLKFLELARELVRLQADASPHRRASWMGAVLGGALGFGSHRKLEQREARRACAHQLQLCSRLLLSVRQSPVISCHLARSRAISCDLLSSPPLLSVHRGRLQLDDLP